ncbi:MAG: ester cyclase [Chloroflexi bacterium]|nr:ester cyclase [Chloroflexota bacterium]
MALEENKAIVERYIRAIWDGLQEDAIEAFLAPDFVKYGPGPVTTGVEFMRFFVSQMRELRGLPDDSDPWITDIAMVAEGDWIASRITRSPIPHSDWHPVAVHPTMASLVTELQERSPLSITVHRVVDGRIVEEWAAEDGPGPDFDSLFETWSELKANQQGRE